MGFLGKNPESKSTKKTGRTLAILSLATKTWWTGKDEQRKEKTEWHRVIVMWNLRLRQVGNLWSLLNLDGPTGPC
jgi:single-strand DNA-binding protein